MHFTIAYTWHQLLPIVLYVSQLYLIYCLYQFCPISSSLGLLASDAFRLFDVDRNGVLSLGEFASGLTWLGFTLYDDTNKNATSASIPTSSSPSPSSSLKISYTDIVWLVSLYDRDHDTSLSLTEFERLVLGAVGTVDDDVVVATPSSPTKTDAISLSPTTTGMPTSSSNIEPIDLDEVNLSALPLSLFATARTNVENLINRA